MPIVTHFNPPKTIPEVLEWLAGAPVSNRMSLDYRGKIIAQVSDMQPLYDKITRRLSLAEERHLIPAATFLNIRRVPQQRYRWGVPIGAPGYPIWALRNVRVESWTRSQGDYVMVHKKTCCRSGGECAGYTDLTTGDRAHDPKGCCLSASACDGYFTWCGDGTINDLDTVEEIARHERVKSRHRTDRAPASGGNSLNQPRRPFDDRSITRKVQSALAKQECQVRPMIEPTRAQAANHPRKTWQRRPYKAACAKNMKHIKQLKQLHPDWKLHVHWPYSIPEGM